MAVIRYRSQLAVLLLTPDGYATRTVRFTDDFADGDNLSEGALSVEDGPSVCGDRIPMVV